MLVADGTSAELRPPAGAHRAVRRLQVGQFVESERIVRVELTPKSRTDDMVSRGSSSVSADGTDVAGHQAQEPILPVPVVPGAGPA